MNIKHWLLQLFVAIDQLLNVLVTPLSSGAWADETLSCRAYRMHRDGKPWGRIWMPIIDLLFIWQSAAHCKVAYQREMIGYDMPPELRRPGRDKP
jgi:hypothetical protein